MAIFITYARKDRAGVEALRQDLERSHNAVWMDNELTGGQSWWDAILGQIRACDLYVFALSPESLKSRACVSELDYALAVGRPLLPVLIRDVHLSLAPPAIANTQIADYRVRTVETGIALVAAVANRRAAPPQPDPLPPPPPPPMSYMNEFAELVDAPALSFQQQNHLLADLRGYLDHDEDDRVAAIELLRGLRRRRDIVESIGRQIDQLVPPQQPTAPPQSYGFAQPSPSSAQSPYGAMGYSGQPAGQPGQYNQPPAPRPMPTSQPTPGGYQPGQPYGSGPAMGPVRRSHPQTATIMVLACLGVVTCAITSIISLVMAASAIKEIDANPGAYGNRQTITMARVIAIISIVAVVFLFILYLQIPPSS